MISLSQPKSLHKSPAFVGNANKATNSARKRIGTVSPIRSPPGLNSPGASQAQLPLPWPKYFQPRRSWGHTGGQQALGPGTATSAVPPTCHQFPLGARQPGELQLHPAQPACAGREMKTRQQNQGCLFTNTRTVSYLAKEPSRGWVGGVLEKQMNLCFMLFKMSNRVQKFIFNRRATQSA